MKRLNMLRLCASFSNFTKKISTPGNLKYFCTKIKVNSRSEQYTTDSIYTSQKSTLRVKDKSYEEFIKLKSEYSTSISHNVKYYVPILLIPMAFHGFISVFDLVFSGKVAYYTPQIFLKHSMIVNSILTGCVVGYRFEEENEKNLEISFSVAYKVIGSCFANFMGIYFLTNVSMGFVLSNLFYLLVASSQIYTLQQFRIVSKDNSNTFFVSYCILLALMLIILNYSLKDYRKQFETNSKFEEAVKVFQISNDADFKRSMNSLEPLLSGLEIKIERIADE
jgi:hypothetical protein